MNEDVTEFCTDFISEKEKDWKEFVYLYFYTYLKTYGSQTVEELEKVWEEQKEYFDDSSNYVFLDLNTIDTNNEVHNMGLESNASPISKIQEISDKKEHLDTIDSNSEIDIFETNIHNIELASPISKIQNISDKKEYLDTIGSNNKIGNFEPNINNIGLASPISKIQNISDKKEYLDTIDSNNKIGNFEPNIHNIGLASPISKIQNISDKKEYLDTIDSNNKIDIFKPNVHNIELQSNALPLSTIQEISDKREHLNTIDSNNEIHIFEPNVHNIGLQSNVWPISSIESTQEISDKTELYSNNELDIFEPSKVSIDEIIAYNNNRTTTLTNYIQKTYNTVFNYRLYQQYIIPKSISLKINSILLFVNEINLDEITITIRPAHEYTPPYFIDRSLRSSGMYSFKCNVNLTEDELNILCNLLGKHLFLLDVQDIETFNFKTHALHQAPVQEIDEISDTADVGDVQCANERCVLNEAPPSSADKTRSKQFRENRSREERMNRALILKDECIAKLQTLWADCLYQEEHLKNQNAALREHYMYLLKTKSDCQTNFKERSLNYLIFIKNLTERQIKKFQEKCIHVLQNLEEIRPMVTYYTTPTAQKVDDLRQRWFINFNRSKECLTNLEVIYAQLYNNILKDEIFDLKTFDFLPTFDETDTLQSDIKQLILENIALKQTLAEKNYEIQSLKQYVYGPVIGLVNKPMQNLEQQENQIRSPVNVEPFNFETSNYYCTECTNPAFFNTNVDEVPNFKSECTESTNIDPFPFQMPTSRSASQVDDTETNEHQNLLTPSITTLKKFITGPNKFNHFQINMKFDRYKKLLGLNLGQLSAKLAKYIFKYNDAGLIVMSKEKLRFFDLDLVPITICFGIPKRTDEYEPFAIIYANFNNKTNLPCHIDLEIKKFSSSKMSMLKTEATALNYRKADNSRFPNSKETYNRVPKSNDWYVDSSEFLLSDSSSKSDFSHLSRQLNSQTQKPGRIRSSASGSEIKSKNKPKRNVLICPICRDVMIKKPQLYLKCGHDFHKECIQTWFDTNKQCPICRNPIIFDEFPPLRLIR